MTLDTKIHNVISALEYYTLSRAIAANVAKVSSNIFKTHEKKMFFIGRVLDYVQPFIKFDHLRVRLHMRLGHENWQLAVILSFFSYLLNWTGRNNETPFSEVMSHYASRQYLYCEGCIRKCIMADESPIKSFKISNSAGAKCLVRKDARFK